MAKNNQVHKIKVTIDKTGKLTGEIFGVSGPACGQLMAWLDEIGKVEIDRAKPEYYEGQQTVHLGE